MTITPGHVDELDHLIKKASLRTSFVAKALIVVGSLAIILGVLGALIAMSEQQGGVFLGSISLLLSGVMFIAIGQIQSAIMDIRMLLLRQLHGTVEGHADA